MFYPDKLNYLLSGFEKSYEPGPGLLAQVMALCLRLTGWNSFLTSLLECQSVEA